MRSGSVLGALAVAALVAAPAFAEETTYCNAFITSLPYTVSTQGHYCFDRNLATAITTGDAITVNADFVVLDLNNFKLGGGSAGPATQTNGIRVNGRSNVTIKNGNVRGFYQGVYLDPTGGTAANNVVQNITADGNLFAGIYVGSPNKGALVQGNNVVNTGGAASAAFSIGIWNQPGDDAVTRDNIVAGTVPPLSGGTGAIGLAGNGWVLRNVVTGTGTGTCFNNSPQTVYRDNNARGCTYFYLGGSTNAGGNFP